MDGACDTQGRRERSRVSVGKRGRNRLFGDTLVGVDEEQY
jgi:hypothetical protein